MVSGQSFGKQHAQSIFDLATMLMIVESFSQRAAASVGPSPQNVSSRPRIQPYHTLHSSPI